MKSKRIQVVLSETQTERFEKQAKKQGRSQSNLARNYIIKGLINDEKIDEPKK